MNSTARLSRPDDINSLRDLDIKCYDYPLTMEQWHKLIEASGKKGEARCVLASYPSSYASKAIAFGVWQYNEEDIMILRLGVLNAFRREGVGSYLVDEIRKDAVRKGAKRLTITVPACHTLPDDPDNVVGFLTACGFRTTGLIYSDWKFMFGRQEDGYEWEATL